MGLLKRLRGAVGTGLTWAAGWAVLGAVHGFVVGLVNPRYWTLANPILDTAFGYAVAGLIAGTGFSGLLAWLDRRSTLERLSRARVVVWGAVGGALVPVLVHLTRGLTSSAGWTDVALTASVTGVLGGGSALVTLWIARRSKGPQYDSTGGTEMLGSPAPDWFEDVAEPAREREPVRREAY